MERSTVRHESTGPSAARAPARTEQPSAIELLRHDHQAVEELFRRFEKLRDGGQRAEKAAIVRETCHALMIHTEVEEKLVYPIARKMLDEHELVEEAGVEHDSIKHLMARIETMKPGHPKYDAVFTVIAEYVRHHVHEEEEEIFPKLRKAGLDTAALAQEIVRYREKLLARIKQH